MSFVGDRLRLARTAAGTTLEELGEAIGSSRQYIQQLESGKRQPNEELKNALAITVGVTPHFFGRPTMHRVTESNCNFRSRRTTLVGAKNRVVACATILGELLAYLDEYVDFPAVDVPEVTIEGFDDAEFAADECRTRWAIPLDAPLENVTRVLENFGIVVTSFPGISEKVDALSFWASKPVVVRNYDRASTSRARFDLAHELGHLVMHRHREVGDLEERVADRFAGAFLVPTRAIRREFPRGVAWPSIFGLKARWGVSVAALVRRAADSGLIDAASYRRANVHIRRRGWHKGEPGEPPPEGAESLVGALNVLSEASSGGLQGLLDSLAISPAMLSRLVVDGPRRKAHQVTAIRPNP